MKILVISGFLGAGKTTFIKMMAEKTGRDFVVFENEYGQADIDAKLLESGSELNVWELTENCVCCSGKADFASSILTISGTLDPEYLIVEPTGVARLSSILDNIRQIQYDRISMLKPLTVLDGNSFDRQCKQYPDIYPDQLKTAGTIVLSKMENAPAEDKEKICEEIRRLNPDADILMDHYSGQELDWWNQLLKQDLDPSATAVEEKEVDQSHFESLSLQQVSLPSPTHLISFLNALTAGVFGDIPRAKGYLPCGCEWLRFDVVDTQYAITGIEVMEEAQCVFIGPHLYRAGLREILLPALSGEGDDLSKLALHRPSENDARKD